MNFYYKYNYIMLRKAACPPVYIGDQAERQTDTLTYN